MKKLSLLLTLFVVFAFPAYATETSVVQMKLRASPEFLQRLEYLLVVEARVVMAENLNTSNHTARANYARLVLNFPSEYANKASTLLAGGVNITSTTTYNSQTDTSTCTATDAAFSSQISTFFNTLAGIETGS